MRCLSCNIILNPREATRKFAESKTFVDLCDSCFEDIKDDFLVIENVLLSNTDDEEPTND